MIGFDLETTGVDTSTDLPVQVALVHLEPDGPGHRHVFLVDPGREVPAAAQAIHGISTERARDEGCPLAEAAEIVHSTLSRAQASGTPVVVMNASYDLTITTGLLERFGLDRFDWVAVVDPLVVDRHLDRYRKGKRRLEDLCQLYGVDLDGAHDAGRDADATLGLAAALCRSYPELTAMELAHLTASQAQWHREWAVEYDAWRRRSGSPGLHPHEFSWPLRRAPVETG